MASSSYPKMILNAVLVSSLIIAVLLVPETDARLLEKSNFVMKKEMGNGNDHSGEKELGEMKDLPLPDFPLPPLLPGFPLGPMPQIPGLPFPSQIPQFPMPLPPPFEIPNTPSLPAMPGFNLPPFPPVNMPGFPSFSPPPV